MIFTADLATLFGGIGQHSTWALLGALPVAVWELSLGVWLVVKGFRPSPITTGMTSTDGAPTRHAVTV